MSLKDELELKDDIDKNQSNYMTHGVVLGILVGSAGMAILTMFGQIIWGGISICIGMLVGMLVGKAIPKKK